MKTNDQNSESKRSGVIRAWLVVLSILLLLSLIFMFTFIVRSGRTNKEKELVETQRLTLLEDYEQLQAEKSEINLQITELETQLHDLEMTSQELLQAKDARIASLGRQSRDTETLREQIEKYREMEVDFDKIKVQYQQLLEEYENLDLKHNNTKKKLTLLQDSVEKSRELKVYNIRPLTKWERWLWADRYHIDRASRVDQTQISFELGGSLFAPHGSRTIYLSMLQPDGTVMYPDQESLTITGIDNPVQYTTKQEVDFSGNPLPITFTIDHPERLSPGEYNINIYMGGNLIRSELMQLQ